MRRISFAAVAIAAAALSLAGCSGGTASPFTGTWTEAKAPTAGETPTLTLASDGKVSGTDGCNDLVGSWTATGTTATFSQLAQTLKACDGVDAWLGAVVTATLDGSTLTIHSADGSAIGELERAG